MNLRFFFSFITFLYCFSVNAQFANNWYFGANAGLNFNTVPPTPLSVGTTSNVDNSSAISDANGNLLFYTDGMKVWNSNNAVMPNGNALIGHFSAGQCCLIVPIPCSSSKYVIFHLTEYSSPGNLNYSVVDMSLAGGLGDVIPAQKNISLGTGWTEKICAYYNPSGNYYWVLAHKWQSNQFVALKVDATTIGVQTVTSSIGSVHNCGSYGGVHDAMGQLTISPDGTKVLNALTCQDKYELFDFNINTGVVSNSIAINGNGGNAWGTGFSPDSKKIYTTALFGQSIYQYDINTYTQPAVQASQVTLTTVATSGYNFGYIELGPDGKIYIARANQPNLVVVNNPNNTGAAANINLNGQTLSPKTSLWGLSRIAYNIQSPQAPPNFSINSNLSQPVSCVGNGAATITCANNTINPNYVWVPGGYTTSAVSNLSAGIYSVVATYSSGCSVFTTSTQFTINSPAGILITTQPVTACKNQTTIISSSVSGGSSTYNYTWMPGGQNTSSISVSATASTVYTLIVSDNLGCTATKTVALTINDPVAGFNYNQNPCSGIFTSTNTSVGSSSYAWDFGDGSQVSTLTSPTHTYSSPGTYSITLTASSGTCSSSITNTVSVSQIVQSNFSTQINFCDSVANFVNNSIGGTTYNWNFGDGTSSTQQNPGTHVYPATGNYTVWLVIDNGSGCKDSTSKIVTAVKSSTANFIYNNSGCATIISFSSTSQYANTYNWQFLNGQSSNIQNPQFTFPSAGNYSVALLINAGTSCSATVTKTIAVGLGPQADFTFSTSLCNTFVNFYNSSSNFTFSKWYFGDATTSQETSPIHQFSQPGTYTVTLIITSGSHCAASVKKVITITNYPIVADFTYTTTELSYDISFINKSIFSQSYFWDFGDNQTSTDKNPIHTYQNVAKHLACLVAQNAVGCTDTICKEIYVDAGWTFYAPNTFSPNDDKINEVFYAYATNISNFKMQVFDRWGQLLFTTEQLEKGWDGTFLGKKVTDDIYAWKASFTDYKSKQHVVTGHIEVLR